ncbi:MAG: hypothetical protein WBP70_07800, partial [Terriglobales bacterium]
MAQKRKEESEFKVSDKRLFTADGDLRTEAAEEQAPPVVATATAAAAPVPAATPATVPMPAASAASVSASPETAAGH